LRTTPSKGTEVPSKAEVTIVVNNATEVPDITGLSKSEAIAELRDAGLDPVDDGEVYDEDVSGGDVASQSPKAGTVVDPSRDTQVKISVSNTEPVPSELGVRAEHARAKLADASVDVDITGPEDGLVWSQSTNTGRTAQRGDTVRISTF